MKKLLLIVVSVLIIGCTDGPVSTATWTLQQPSAAYEIDAWGTNPDILEFTPEGNPNYVCMLAVSGTDNLRTMFCIPKPEESKE